MADTEEIGLYVAANSAGEARAALLWDDPDEAEQYRRENGLGHVYRVPATVDFGRALDVEAKLDMPNTGQQEVDQSRWLPHTPAEDRFREALALNTGKEGTDLEREVVRLRDYRHATFGEPSVEARHAYARLAKALATARALHVEAPGHEPVAVVDQADLDLLLRVLEKYL